MKQGFTLLELIIVITLISMVMFFTLPSLDDGFSFNQTDQFSRWLSMNVLALRDRAQQENKIHALSIDLGLQTITVLDEAALHDLGKFLDDNDSPRTYAVPNDIRIMDVEYPRNGKISYGQALIRFYPQGYSDKALIHASDRNGDPITFLIEPFLSKITRFDYYADFDH